MNVHLLGKPIFPECEKDNGVAPESGDGNAGNQAFMIGKTFDTTCYSDRTGLIPSSIPIVKKEELYTVRWSSLAPPRKRNNRSFAGAPRISETPQK